MVYAPFLWLQIRSQVLTLLYVCVCVCYLLGDVGMSGDFECEWVGMELFFSRARSHPTGRSKPGRGRRMRELPRAQERVISEYGLAPRIAITDMPLRMPSSCRHR